MCVHACMLCARVRACVCVCVCACVRACACVCVRARSRNRSWVRKRVNEGVWRFPAPYPTRSTPRIINTMTPRRLPPWTTKSRNKELHARPALTRTEPGLLFQYKTPHASIHSPPKEECFSPITTVHEYTLRLEAVSQPLGGGKGCRKSLCVSIRTRRIVSPTPVCEELLNRWRIER